MKPVLVIGATGNIGREVVAQLVAAGVSVRALARNPDAVPLPAGVDLRRADLTAPDTLDPCLDGIDAVFLVWTAPITAVEAAIGRIAKRARRIVFLTAPLKSPHPFFQQPNPGRALAETVERTIEASGLAWTYLRAGMFALDARHFWGPQIRAGDAVRWPYLDAPTAPTDERDIAAAGIRALLEDGHAGKEYVITGPESLTQREQIAIIGDVLGRDLHIEEVPPDQWNSGMPPAVARMLLDAWAAARGLPAWVTTTVEEVTGRPARPFRDWVAANLDAFR
jgi:uncharacterized protein YbjT (DUF2867 family)